MGGVFGHDRRALGAGACRGLHVMHRSDLVEVELVLAERFHRVLSARTMVTALGSVMAATFLSVLAAAGPREASVNLEDV
jgi:hypothetical protein